jgi:predicted NACHT family NTPase
MLLVAEPGMGKSTFLCQMEHKIKERNTEVWVLRINLNEHTRLLKNIKSEEECFNEYQTFLWSVAHPTEQGAEELVKKIFLQALKDREKMVIILDGFDEISPKYTAKVNNLIRAIREKTASRILVSSRLSHRQSLEEIVENVSFTLQPFTRQKQIEFLEQYWNKDVEKYNEGNLRIEKYNEGSLGMFAEKLLNLFSKNISDKDKEFTGIPLQTMMLGEAFVEEAKEYCLKGQLDLPERLNLLDLFKKFWKTKCDIYFSGKNKMDISQPKVISEKKSYLENHMIAALMSLFSLSKKNVLLGAINDFDLQHANKFLQSGTAEKCGIIREVADGKQNFIHRCFADYFAAYCGLLTIFRSVKISFQTLFSTPLTK